MKKSLHVWALTLCIATLAPLSHAGLIVTEDFETGFTGSSFPGTNANGQGGWAVNLRSANIRNDFTTGSLDGNVFSTSVSGGAHAYRNDGVIYVDAGDTEVVMSFSGRVGGLGGDIDRWTRFGVGFYDGTNLNPGLYFGSQGSQWGVLLGSGTGGGDLLATSTDGFPGFWEIHDMRLTVDLVAETAVFEHDAGLGAGWVTPSGLGSIDVSALDQGGSFDGRNPLLWNSLYFRGIAAGDTVDNLYVAAVPEPATALLLALGLGALALRRR